MTCDLLLSASTAEDDPFTFGNQSVLKPILLIAVVRLNISCFGVFSPADYHRLRVGGLILAAVLCLIGIMILLSKTEKAHARART